MIFRILGIVLLIGLIVFLYLGIHGVPRRYADRLLDQFHPTGYTVTMERLRLNLMTGITVDNLRFFEDEDRLQPILEAKRVLLSLNPLDWFQDKFGFGGSKLTAVSTIQGLDNLRGRLTLTEVEAMGIWIEKGAAKFAIREGRVNIAPIVANLGKSNQKSKLQGYLDYNPDSGDYEGRVETSLNPHLLTPLLNSNQAKIVNSFVFKNEPIAIEVDFSGRIGDDDALRVAGCTQISNFIYQTAPITLFKSCFCYTNGAISVDGLRLVRPEGEVTGHLKEHLKEKIIDINVTSTIDPAIIVKLLGPGMADNLNGIHFGGPMRISARGRIDHGAGALTDIQANANGSYLAYAPLEIDRWALKAKAKGHRINLTDIRGELYEGTLSGKASFYPVGAITNFKYDVSVRLDDISLSTLPRPGDHQDDKKYEGMIYSQCAISGFIGKGRDDTVSGGGWFRIQNGQFFQKSLLGGFFRMFSTLYPDIGTVSLTDFSANFNIKDRKVETHDAMLSGEALAIFGEGYYAFDETLDFIVWIRGADSKTLFSPLTKVTSPLLSKLLVVRLTGTLSDLKCWPLNLTKDQLLALPKDIIIDMPKDVLQNLPKDLLITLPNEVVVALPKKLFINLPNEFLKMFKPSSKK